MSVIGLLRTEPSLRRPVFAFTALLAVVLVGERIVETAIDRVVDGTGGFPLWLPQLGTVGETVTYYLLFFDFLKFVGVPLALMWIAYASGRYCSGPSRELK